MAEPILGIDLGTTNSALAILEDGLPKLISIDEQRILPSVVGLSPQGELLVGTPARNQWVALPENTVRSIKRHMGTSDTVSMADNSYSPQEISAFILRHIQQAASQALQQDVRQAVITVPAYFSEVQRQATLEAGQIAGLEVVRIINEPTAAALAYGLNQGDDLNIVVYDLGGGTFDISVIELSEGILDVRATAGDNHLGGDDIDSMLAEYIAADFAKEHGVDLREHRTAWVRLLRAAEEAKIIMSSQPFAQISLEYVLEHQGKALHIDREVSRDDFEDLINNTLLRTLEHIDQALADAELDKEDIDRVLLVGGSTRMPLVRRMVTEHLGCDPHLELDPDAVVALGAAVQGGIISGEAVDTILVDVTPLSLGIEIADISRDGNLQPDIFSVLIARNSTIPVQKSEQFSTMFPGQDAIEIKVYQGENRIASRNTLLGEFKVEELLANRLDGRTDITVNFRLDVSGLLEVSVEERQSGQKVSHSLHAERQRLSLNQIADSQGKLAALPADVNSSLTDAEAVPAGLDEEGQALFEQALQLLEDDELDNSLASSIAGALADIRRAAQTDDPDELSDYINALADVLLEAEV